MEDWLLTVPLGSNIIKCTQYLSACFHAWQEKYESMYRVELHIPHDLYLAPEATRVNHHLTHVAKMREDCTAFWKQIGKERRGLKRQHTAVSSKARSSGDAWSLEEALDLQEWALGEVARKKALSRSYLEEVEAYEENHILL